LDYYGANKKSEKNHITEFKLAEVLNSVWHKLFRLFSLLEVLRKIYVLRKSFQSDIVPHI